MTALRVRPMVGADIDAVSELYLAANPFATVETIRTWTAQDMAARPGLHFVCLDGVAIVGAVSGNIVDGVGVIEDVAVSRARQGIGSLLYGRVLEALRQTGTRRVLLWTHWKCAASIPFHYAQGFRIVRAEKTSGVPFVPDGEDIIVLERLL